MDSYRDHPSDFEPSVPAESSSSEANADQVGTEERRKQVRAYNHWVSLLDGRELPSIDDLAPADANEFSDHSVLFELTSDLANPALRYLGQAIRDQCGLEGDVRTLADVPPRTLLSRIAGHCPQMVASRAPVGFESEFVNLRGDTLCCRGVLLPFSTDGTTIDFVFAVIGWKEIEAAEADEPFAPATPPQDNPLAALIAKPGFSPALTDVLKLADEIAAATALDAGAGAPPSVPAPLPRLAERLSAARSTAETVKVGESRTRAALYQALSLAYDFALAAGQKPDEYAELLEASGVTVQARAPMTAIVKLVFGVDYDKTRLTEFAAALSYAKRQRLGAGELQPFIEQQDGGLKAIVAAERAARRPEPKADKGDAARARLRLASPITLADVPAAEEFAVVLTRRCADGGHEPVAVVVNEALIERVIRTIG